MIEIPYAFMSLILQTSVFWTRLTERAVEKLILLGDILRDT